MTQPTRTSELWIELSQEQQEIVSGGLTLTFPEVSLSIDLPSIFGRGGSLPSGDDLPFLPDDSDRGCVRKDIPLEDGRDVEIICDRQTEKLI
ncbi:MAG: hypothetical protein KME17_21640 [Cyanosarcina radialis HA8281-LM2]|jgi:hypothetical protein|nr:hypothetical protein [Cyanosarcina radialis HA8281-LM2]